MKLNKLVLKFVSISFSILVMLLVVIGLIKLGSFCYDFGYRVFTEGPVEEEPGTDVSVDVTDDLSEYQIGKLLKKEGLIRDANLFYVQLRMSAYHGKLKAGTYTLNTSMTAKDMMAVMAAEAEESTESTENTEYETDSGSAGQSSSDGTKTDGAGEENQNTDENEQAGADIKVEGDSVVVKRQYEDRYHELKAKMPCLVTALSELNEPRYMTPGGIFDAFDKEVTVWGRADLKDVDDSDLGLKGSPTKIAKASDKVAKGAGEKVNLDPAESVAYLIGKFKEKHII